MTMHVQPIYNVAVPPKSTHTHTHTHTRTHARAPTAVLLPRSRAELKGAVDVCLKLFPKGNPIIYFNPIFLFDINQNPDHNPDPNM